MTRLTLPERALIHADRMDEQGWYVTANVLAASADALAIAAATVASIRTRAGQITAAREKFTAQSPLQIWKATDELLQAADRLEAALSAVPSQHHSSQGE